MNFTHQSNSRDGSKQMVKGLLLVCVGLITVSCSNDYRLSDESVIAAVPHLDPEPALSAIVNELDLQPGIPYAEARSLLIDQGWIPHTFMTTAPLADWSDPKVQSMQAMGFSEAKSCTHPQADICVFEFVYTDRTLSAGAVLSVLASTADSTTDEAPTLWSWGLQNSTETTYAEQPFDQAVFNQLRQAGICAGIAYDCSYQKYAFKDALLIAAPYDYGATKISLLPREPVSREAALSYARILDAHAEIDFDTAPIRLEEDPNRETYSGCVIGFNNGGDAQFPATCFIALSFTPNGTVSEISIHNAVP